MPFFVIINMVFGIIILTLVILVFLCSCEVFMKINRKNKRFLPSRAAMTLLKLGLPFISAALVALTFELQNAVSVNPGYAIITYPDMYCHIFASLLALIAGAMIFDVIEKSSKGH